MSYHSASGRLRQQQQHEYPMTPQARPRDASIGHIQQSHHAAGSSPYWSSPDPRSSPPQAHPYINQDSYASHTPDTSYQGNSTWTHDVRDNNHPEYYSMRHQRDDIEQIRVDYEPEDNPSHDARSNYSAAHPEHIQEEAGKPIFTTSVREVKQNRRGGHPDTNMKAMDRVLNRLMDAIKAKHWLYWMSPKYFHRDAVFSTKNPGSYQAPSRTPQSGGSNDKKYVHLDVFRRGRKLNNDDYYLDPLNGKLRKLFVQTTDTIYESNTDVRSWRRTYIRNVSPRLIRLAFWPYSAAPSSRGSHKLKRRDNLDKVNSRTADWDQSHWVAVGARWLPACIGLLVLMCLPTDAEGQVRNNGFYDPVPYKWWSYPTAARNIYEDRNVQALSKTKHVLMERRHLPRFLCFIDRVRDRNKYPRGRMTPEEWMKETGESVPPAYLFVSYTGEQFKRACPEGWKQFGQRGKVECNCEQCQSHKSDVEFLHEKSRQAAKEIGVIAYWTDQNCMSTDEVEHSQDVYSICDIVRAACSIAIIVGQAGTNELPQDVTTSDLMKDWGKRLWTYPEILLSPIGKPITVYTRGSSRKPWQVSKAHFAKLIWNDADSSRQLMEHYENSLTLSRLELVVIALECMTNRVHRGTTNYKEGDLAYCLMGLLRQRPRVEADDTAFQAFARLSLSNDSDQLLERMICLLTDTKSEDQRIVKNAKGDEEINNRHWWTNLEDAWGVRLWDIEPLCQVAGIADNDTVILDGAYGATVTWDSFERVAITTRETWSRMLARLLVRFSPVWFLVDLVILVIGSSNNDPGMIAFGVLILLLVLTLILLSPILVLNIYSGKVWNAQPWLFGFEGYMDLDAIERKIFGFPCDRLTWAPYSSPLSQHTLNEQFLDDECQGTTPLLSDTDSQAGNSSTAHEVNGMRLFTIVDTHTMTVSVFRAERPPVVALLCGSEGGMQRAVMCSYDWTTQTFYRETVLRMETRMLDRTPRIGRVRFGMKRMKVKM